MRAKITMLVGALLMLSGYWLHDATHAKSFGVSTTAWTQDLVAGLLILIIGGIAQALGRRER